MLSGTEMAVSCTEIYIPLCLYLYIDKAVIIPLTNAIYIPLCLYLYAPPLGFGGLVSLIYIPLCLYLYYSVFVSKYFIW